MGVLAQPVPARPLPGRTIILVALAALVALVGASVFIGSQPKLPPPFGLARNGVIVVGTPDGDLVAVDPLTSQSTMVLGDPAVDLAPWVSHDGQRILFVRAGPDDLETVMIANVDGTEVRPLIAGSAPETFIWWDWSADDRRVVVTFLEGALERLGTVDVATGVMTRLDIGGVSVREPSWRPNHDEIVFRGDGVVDGTLTHGLFLVQADGSGIRPILTARSSLGFLGTSLSPDGRSVAYARWHTPDEQGRIRIVDIDTGVDRQVSQATDPDQIDLAPLVSPDGSRVAIERYGPGIEGYRLAVIPSSGAGPELLFGPDQPSRSNGAIKLFSPDGTQLLVHYNADASNWLFDLTTGEGQRVNWPMTDAFAWQRTG